MSAPKSPNYFLSAKQLKPRFIRSATFDYYVGLIWAILIIGCLLTLALFLWL